MNKIIRNSFLFILAILLLTIFVGCKQEETPDAVGGKLKIEVVNNIPSAYLDESYDLREVILMETGVEYSATASYVEYIFDATTKEFTAQKQTVEVTDLSFTPNTLNETVVVITAVRGEETATKTIYVQTSIRAEPLDELYQSNGVLGGSDSGITKSINLDTQYLQGDKSATSLHVEFNAVDPHAFGNMFLELSSPEAQKHFTDQIWDNAIVTFWVFNPMEKDIEFQLAIVDNTHAEMRDWSTVEGPHRQFAKAGEWTQIFFSLRNLGTKHKLVRDAYSNEYLAIKMQYADFNLTSAYTYHFYMDNLDVVPAGTYPEINTAYTMTDEDLDQGWENMTQDIGWQGAYTIYDYENMNGEGSVCSLKATFPGEKGKTNSFICLSPEAVSELKGTLDMTGGKFHGYFKFENMPAKVTLDIINGKWEASNAVEFALQDAGNGWYYGEIDLNDVRIGAGRSDNIVRIRLNFEGVTDNSVVYVDTLKYDYEYVDMKLEPISQDWINLPLDQGMTVVSSNKYTSDKVKAKDSVRSVQVIAPGNQAGVITFNTELAVINGDLPALPNMTKGTVHAYFYFGNQEPQASLKLANEQWKASKEVNFIFDSVGDGWYYGSIPAGLLQGYEVGNGSKIIRMMVNIPAGYNVYIDGLMHFPNEEYASNTNPDDVFASGIFTKNGFTSGSGAEITTEVINGSKEAIHIWADKKVGWPNVGVSFVTPVDISSYKDISVDVKAQNAWKWMEIKLFYMDSNGAEQYASVGVDFTQEDWQTVTKKLSAFKDANLKKVTGILICVNFDDGFQTGGRNEFWFDNMRLSDGSSTPDLGDPFVAGSDKQIELDQIAKLETLSFDYQITNDGTLAVAALNNDWSKYYGYYEFNGEGCAWDYSGVTCEKLDNGYIRVTMTISQLNRTNNSDNRDNAPDVIALLYISANMNTADGYINNITYVVDDGENPDEPTEPEITEPEETEPTPTYNIGVGTEIDVEDGAYDYITFEYQITNGGTLSIAALSPDWGKYYGYYELGANGKIWEDNGVYSEKLDDGFVRVTLITAEMDRTNNSANANNRPAAIGLLYVGNFNTATGVIRNVAWGVGEVIEPEEPEVTEPEITEPEITETEITEPESTEPTPTYDIAVGLEIDVEDGAYDYITFEYQLTNNGMLAIAALNPDWGKYYGYYEFNTNGKVWEDNGVYAEKMDDGFVRVTLITAEMDRTNNSANANNRPEQIGLVYIGNANTATGVIRNVVCGTGNVDVPSEPTEPEVTEPEITEPDKTQYYVTAGNDLIVDLETIENLSAFSFEYQLTSGTFNLALLMSDWTSYYGYFAFDVNGNVDSYDGVTVEHLDDEYIRVIFEVSKLTQYTGTPDAGFTVFYVRGNWSDATGIIRNLQMLGTTEDTPNKVLDGTDFVSGMDKTILTDCTNNLTRLSFDYKITGGESFNIALMPDWNSYYGYFAFDMNGNLDPYDGVTCEFLENGYIRVTFDMEALTKMNGSPVAVLEFLYIRGNWSNASGEITNICLYWDENQPRRYTRMSCRENCFLVSIKRWAEELSNQDSSVD